MQVSDSSTLLLGTDFHPLTGELLVVDFGKARVVRVDKQSGAASVFTQPTGAGGLNAMTFDRLGNVYISDSFKGTVWRVDATGGVAQKWVTHALLAPLGNPRSAPTGFGARAGLGVTPLFTCKCGRRRFAIRDRGDRQRPRLSRGAFHRTGFKPSPAAPPSRDQRAVMRTPSKRTSARRFSARPSVVALSASGAASPCAWTRTIDASSPWLIK